MAKSNLAETRLWIDWRSQDLVEVLPAAVYVCDADAVVVAYNRRAAELWGREPAIGDTDEKYCGSHRLYHPDGAFLPHHETPMARVLRTGEPACDAEVVIERPDGSRVIVLANIAPLLDETGELIGAVNCFQDLAVQKQGERDRLRAAEELHQARKIEALGTLTASVAHDFNNIISAILANLELLKEGTSEPGATKLVDNAIRSARRGAKLNEQLLGFGRRHPMRSEPLDLNRLLGGMEELLQTSAGAAISVEQRLDPEAWPAQVDPNRIELVVLNLVINARDAMPLGGTVTIATDNATYDAGNVPPDLAPGDYVVLAISDTGMGMSEQVRAMGFEPFFSTKGPGKGTGLGLSMVFDVAKESGGSARIASRLGEGTSVEVYLPCAARPASAEVEKAEPAPRPAAGRRATVLVVDDDDDVREIMAVLLDSLGYDVIEANGGDAALAILGAQQIDLMLIDIGMPGMGGVETVCRARQRQPALLVLFSTGYAATER